MTNTRIIFALVLFAIGACQKSSSSASSDMGSSAAQSDFSVGGTVYRSSSGTGLYLNGQDAPAAGVDVEFFKLNLSDLSKTSLAKTTTDGNGGYTQSLSLTEKTALLITAFDRGSALGAAILIVDPSASLLLTSTLNGDITSATTAMASILLARATDLSRLNADALSQSTQIVSDAIKQDGSKDVDTLVQNLVNSQSVMNKIKTVIADSGLSEQRASTIIDKLSSAVPFVASAGTQSIQSLDIELDKTSFAKGETSSIKVYATYRDNSRVNISAHASLSSSNQSVVTVSTSNGVHAVDVGSAKISATYNGKSAEKSVTVTAAALVSIGITPASATLANATNQQFTATGTYSDNSTQDLTASVTWVSNTPSIATVSDTVPSKGVALTVSAGAGQLTASLGDVSAQVTFTVTNATLSSIQVTPASTTLPIGLTANMTATGLFSDSTTQDLTSFVTWSSDDATLASVSNTSGTKGRVSAVSIGTANISATYNSVTGSQAIQVTAAEVTSVQITPSSASLAKGTTTDLTATGIFSDATNSDITSVATWSSNNTAVATVTNAGSPRGRVTAVAVGTATVTASYNGKSITSTITVTPATLASLAITPAAPTTPLGGTRQFTATGTYSDASTADLTTSVTWSSSNTSKASISNATGSKGLATTAGVGSTTITAALNSVTGDTTFTVSAAQLVSIAVTPSTATVAKGLNRQFTATGTYSDASTQDVTSSVTWTSSDTNVATISNAGGSHGLATAADVGSATITATLGAVSGTAAMTVTSASLVSIAVTPPAASIAKGLTQQYTATGTYSDSTTADLTTQVTWQSSSSSTATISNVNGTRGLATSVAVGTTTISAALSSVSGDTTLTITAAELVSIALTASSTSVAKGLTRQFTATGTYTDSSTQNVTSSASWASDDTAVSTVSSSGLASALATGSAGISATVGSVTGSTTLTVTAATLVSIAVTPASASVAVGSTQQYTATGTYTDASTLTVTGSATWSSSSTSYATISSGGLATGVSIGSSTITATLGSVSGQTDLTVTAQVTPPDPSGLSATVNSTSQITLSWTSGGGTTASFKIAYQSGATAPSTCSSGTTTTTSSVTQAISSLSAGTQYSFRVCALSGDATPFVSAGITASATTLQAVPPDPTGLTATASSSAAIALSWVSGGGSTTTYKIAYQSGATAPSDCSSGTTTTSSTASKSITSLSAETQYSFRVCAVNGNTTPDVSSGVTVSGTTLQATPPNPSGQSATVDSTTQITLSWTSGGGSTASYKIAYQSGATAPSTCSSGTTTTASSSPKAITGLTSGTQYSFRICALNSNPTPNASTGVTVSATTNTAIVYIVDNDETTGSYLDTNNNATLSYTGTWNLSTVAGRGFTSDYRLATPTAAATPTATATWVFNGLTVGATYRVSTTWFAQSNRGTTVKYTVSTTASDGSDGSASSTVSINQTLTPSSLTANGASWQDVSTGFVVGSGGTLQVVIHNKTDGYVTADAIRLELIP